MISADTTGEPRTQVSDAATTAQVFGVDVDDWRAGATRTVDATAFGYPLRSLSSVPPGRYRVQAMINRYQTYRRSDGHTVKLPPDKWEGQQYANKPGNLYSRAVNLTLSRTSTIPLVLDQEIPPVADFAQRGTKYVKYLRIKSDLLSKFWGTDTYLGAWVLLPEGFDSHPDARYPLVINHGHFPAQTRQLARDAAEPGPRARLLCSFLVGGLQPNSGGVQLPVLQRLDEPGLCPCAVDADPTCNTVLRRLVRGELA